MCTLKFDPRVAPCVFASILCLPPCLTRRLDQSENHHAVRSWFATIGPAGGVIDRGCVPAARRENQYSNTRNTWVRTWAPRANRAAPFPSGCRDRNGSFSARWGCPQVRRPHVGQKAHKGQHRRPPLTACRRINARAGNQLHEDRQRSRRCGAPPPEPHAVWNTHQILWHIGASTRDGIQRVP